MNILLVNHETASNWCGGDGVQMVETAKRLRQRGHHVDVVNSNSPDVKDFDIVHIFNCRVPGAFPSQVEKCKSFGVPVVVSPIWINLGRALWGSRGSLAILEGLGTAGREEIEARLERLRRRNLVVRIKEGDLSPIGVGSSFDELTREIGDVLVSADGILVNSWLELKAVQSDLLWTGEKYGVAYYGADPKEFLNADARLFRELTGINEPFVLQAGRIEPGKNQAMLCWALKDSGLPIVLIGRSSHWPNYARLCKEIYGDKIYIIDNIERKILASAYAASRVHSLVSWMDTCGLVSLEAALNGTPIVGSTFGHELEYLRNDAWLADPADSQGIRKAVLDAWDEGKNTEKSNRLKQRVLAEYNWEQATDETERMYVSILKEKVAI